MNNYHSTAPHKRHNKDTESTSQFQLSEQASTSDDLSTPEGLKAYYYANVIKNCETESENKGLFKVKTASQWLEQAMKTPIPEMLFGELWHENELCILFADTNLGKSILAVQIGNSLSKGEQVAGFRLESKKQSILYFDFELSAKQFEVRYSVKNEPQKVFEQHYNFDANFIRVEINPEAEIPEGLSFENYLNESLELSITDTRAKILIIDNLTYLRSETERAKDALPLMKHLKALKNKYRLSILALAHTPKRDMSKPITKNDLQGSKMLINFADSSFAIGESHSDKSLRYIKQIKARNTEILYDTENVIVCQIHKPHNFLEFDLLDYGTEREHLRQISDSDKKQLEQSIIGLHNSNPTFSLRKIASQLRTNPMKVKRTIDKLK